MKLKTILCILSSVICLFALCLLAGCQMGQLKEPVKIFINEEGTFPGSLAGRWVAEDHGWEFVLNEEGGITSAVIALGKVHMIPGKTEIVPMREGGKGIFKPGQWTVTYTPSSRELVVEVVMNRIRAEMGPNVLEGSSRDVFVGVISDDSTEWKTDWITIPNYIAYVPEPHDLSYDPEETITKVIFKKAE